jgi:exoribonuclease-2
MSSTHTVRQFDLQAAARECMLEHGFAPDFSPEVRQQVAAIQSQAVPTDSGLRDLRGLLWSSIDNDTSRDLDQIEVAEQLANGDIIVRVGIADVDSRVPLGTPIDQHAQRETTTVYTGVRNFPMLPEELSTGITSLNENSDRVCVVVEFTVSGSDGCIVSNQIYRALVRNHAQLAYNSVGAWLDGTGAAPAKVAASADLQAQLKLQDKAAQLLRAQRYIHGALDIETIETNPVLLNNQAVDIESQQKNRATQLIEDFMIAANNVVARTLGAAGVSSIRRVVKVPKRWDRIVEVARQLGETLPDQPDSKALNDFLMKRRVADPDHFADLSVAIVKLLGPGEYVLEKPGADPIGHFGLAVRDYTHSTAPNRRFADIAAQRLVKAMLAKQTSPYSDDALTAIASNCTLKEDGERKVEREMQKRIAAVVMSGRIGETFSAIVTGVNKYGTFVRVLKPHLEGMLVTGAQGLDVGDRAQVKLIRTDPQRGFIDFSRSS